MTDPLHALSPLDGRYADATAPLRDYFSEFAFLRDRARVELDLLPALSRTGLTRPLTDSETAQIEAIKTNFSSADAELILEHERKTRHDVKAIEYFIRSKLQNTSLKDLLPWIHFGLTSEDTNSLGQAMALNESRQRSFSPHSITCYPLYPLSQSVTKPSPCPPAPMDTCRSHDAGKEFAV
jgi:Adenylosuccinate lyase